LVLFVSFLRTRFIELDEDHDNMLTPQQVALSPAEQAPDFQTYNGVSEAMCGCMTRNMATFFFTLLETVAGKKSVRLFV
jgi:hypothetical protein